ncbi:FitA-like ribbon-helix-helix domain-containing protein [Chelativorans alearense]|uniref:FitA-like ribbon-helix-helix domain-containing protein n=1 Tax=Chelativorans alearense TaxID=2681495 RepID=UPI0013D2CBA1|nr:plasmid stabilization protein [Chelativorans alearense]
MGDMLVRGIDAELKRRLEEGARQHKRSLSQEAIDLMRKGLTAEKRGDRNFADRLRAEMRDGFFTDEELAAIRASRKEPDRNPPSLV